MKAVRLSREELHRLGYKPGDGRGGVIAVASPIVSPMPLSLEQQAELERSKDEFWAGYGALKPPKPAIHIPRTRKPNATEARWFLSAKARWPALDIRYEAISFRLNSGAKYTPDFSGWDGARLLWVCEVKGAFKLGSQSRSVLAWKTAAHEWPAIQFIFATRKDGEFVETTIGPQ